MDLTLPVPPLLVGEPYDVDFFATQAALARYVEPWYVERDYVAWDALGRELELAVVDAPVSGFVKRRRTVTRVVEARLRGAAADSSQECAAFLREWLLRVDGPALPAEATLPELLIQALIRGDLHR